MTLRGNFLRAFTLEAMESQEASLSDRLKEWKVGTREAEGVRELVMAKGDTVQG